MKCKNCGNEIIEGNKFCAKCGAEVPISQVQKNSKNKGPTCPQCDKHTLSKVKKTFLKNRIKIKKDGTCEKM